MIKKILAPVFIFGLLGTGCSNDSDTQAPVIPAKPGSENSRFDDLIKAVEMEQNSSLEYLIDGADIQVKKINGSESFPGIEDRIEFEYTEVKANIVFSNKEDTIQFRGLVNSPLYALNDPTGRGSGDLRAEAVCSNKACDKLIVSLKNNNKNDHSAILMWTRSTGKTTLGYWDWGNDDDGEGVFKWKDVISSEDVFDSRPENEKTELFRNRRRFEILTNSFVNCSFSSCNEALKNILVYKKLEDFKKYLLSHVEIDPTLTSHYVKETYYGYKIGVPSTYTAADIHWAVMKNIPRLDSEAAAKFREKASLKQKQDRELRDQFENMSWVMYFSLDQTLLALHKLKTILPAIKADVDSFYLLKKRKLLIIVDETSHSQDFMNQGDGGKHFVHVYISLTNTNEEAIETIRTKLKELR